MSTDCDYFVYLDDPPSDSWEGALFRTPSEQQFPYTPNQFCPDFFREDDEKTQQKPPPKEHFPQYCNELESRTILVSNIHEATTKERFSEIVSPYGEIKAIDVSDLASGDASVTFFDLRSAHRLRAAIPQALSVHGRCWCVRFAPPNRLIPIGTEPSPKTRKVPNTGTIVVFQLKSGTSDETIRSVFSQYGEIREIRWAAGKDTQVFVEFWDLRAAARAKKATNRRKIPELGAKIATDYSKPGGFRKEAPNILRDVCPKIERPKKPFKELQPVSPPDTPYSREQWGT
jgi:RNA recognition motif-containing protein